MTSQALDLLDLPPAPESLDLAVDPQEAYEKAKGDINFFAALAMPEVCIFALPYFYLLIWQVLVNRKLKDMGKILRFALGLPRGHAKTTFVKLLLAWMIAYDRAEFILVICANSDLAENLVEDLDAILGSPNMEAVYGAWSTSKIEDTKKQIRARYHDRSIILVARGADSAVRGINIHNKRPDVIFCDDAQTKENDESESERKALLRRLTATVFKTITPTHKDRLIIYVGNMYSEGCILNRLRVNSRWTSLITGAILENGAPLWPELHSLEDLMESYYHDEELGEADGWFAEVMNDPKNSATTILPESLKESSIDEELFPVTQWDSTFITIDPAGFRLNSDDNVVVVHGLFDGIGHTIESSVGIKNPEELIKTALTLALKHGSCLIGVESVGYQQTLAFWLQKYLVEYHLDSSITVVELSPHGRSKESRIRQHIQEMYAGQYYITDPITRAAYVWQALKYRLGVKKNKDDLLDAVAYYQDIRNEFWHLLKEPQYLKNRTLANLVYDNTPF